MGKLIVSSIYEKIKKFNSLCATLAGLILLFITISIFIDVILRYFFNKPSIWITEVSSYLFLYIIFFGTAYALQNGLHIRVTFLIDQLNKTLTRIFNLLTSLLGILFSFALLWQTSSMTWAAYSEGWTSPTMLSAPYAYVHVSMAFGSLLLFITFVFRTILIFIGSEAESSE